MAIAAGKFAAENLEHMRQTLHSNRKGYEDLCQTMQVLHSRPPHRIQHLHDPCKLTFLDPSHRFHCPYSVCLHRGKEPLEAYLTVSESRMIAMSSYGATGTPPICAETSSNVFRLISVLCVTRLQPSFTILRPSFTILNVKD